MKVKGFQLFCLVVLIGGQSVASARQNNGSSLPKLHSSKLRREVFLSRNKVIGSTKHSKALKMVTIPRGGACSDTNPVVFAKIGTTSIVESFALYGILWSSVKLENSSILPSWLPTIFNQSLVVLLASLLVVFGSSFIGAIVDGGMSAATNQALSPTEVAGDPDWYAKLAKPSWNPPGWVFPIMWLIVSKPTQLVGLLRILKFGFPTDKKASTVALVVFTTHLALGNAWNKVFFELQCIGLGTVTITIFYALLLASAYLFSNIETKAGYFLLPTCGWVSVATALQYSIYFKN